MFNLPSNCLCNILSDEPNINKAIWRKLDGGLKERGYKGLIEFINCTLHVMHNGFGKGITAKGGLDETIEQLTFNLHAWFKVVNIFMSFRINFLKKICQNWHFFLCVKTYIKTYNVSRHDKNCKKTSKYNIKFC